LNTGSWTVIGSRARGAVALGVGLLWLAFTAWNSPLPALQWDMTVGRALMVLLFTAATTVVPLLKWMNPQSAVRGYLMKAAMARLLSGDVPGANNLAERYLAARAEAKDPIVDKAAPDFKATRSTAENSLWPITRARY
jgi:hypothetical protein